MSGDCVCAISHDVAKTFALGDHFSSLGHAIRITPGEFAIAVCVAFFAGFHPYRKRVTDLDGIQTKVVGKIDHLGDKPRVIIANVRANRPGGFVFN